LIRFLQASGLALVATATTLLAAEALFRALDWDFSGERAAQSAHPIFYRLPSEPLGPVFFRRPGPDTWVGNVLSQGFRAQWGDRAADPFPNEPVVRVDYDRDGFRNPDDLAAWEIAVMGDSFTELGQLAWEDLFTTELARRLGLRVKNLGASFTGPLSHRLFLERFGASPALEHALLVFFEGNDLEDLGHERAAFRRWRRTGVRPRRSIVPQTSLFRHLQGRLAARPAPQEEPAWSDLLEIRKAYFASEAGEIPVTLNDTPPGRDGVPQPQAFTRALAAFAGTARRLGATPWLVYMPCKRRALHGHLRFGERTEPDLVEWTPTDLPDFVREQAEGLGMSFVDLTPALLAEAARGRLLYNPVWDTHLNRAGSHRVARELAEALSAAAERARRRTRDRG